MINQPELAEAIETISEGGQALGVSSDDVYTQMATDRELVQAVFEHFHNTAKDKSFENLFSEGAKSLLTEALRAKQEVDAGCL